MYDFESLGVTSDQFHKYMVKARWVQFNANRRGANAEVRVDRITRYIAELLLTRKTCYWCKRDLKTLDDKTIDHLIPFNRGGGHTIGNVVISCPKCNHEKDNMTKHEFERYMKYKNSPNASSCTGFVPPQFNKPKREPVNHTQISEEQRIEMRMQELWGKGNVWL
jgi:5-methylcytosine-specific restriction endonuclease McrA